LTAGGTVANEEFTVQTLGSYRDRRQHAMESEPEPKFMGLNILDFPQIVNTSRRAESSPQSYAAALKEDSSLQSGDDTIRSEMSALTLENMSLRSSVDTLNATIKVKEQQHDQNMKDQEQRMSQSFQSRLDTIQEENKSQLATLQEANKEQKLQSAQELRETKLELVAVQSNMVELNRTLANSQQEADLKYVAAEARAEAAATAASEKAETARLESEAARLIEAAETKQKADQRYEEMVAAQAQSRIEAAATKVQADQRYEEMVAIQAASKLEMAATQAKSEAAAKLDMRATMQAMMLQMQSKQVAASPQLEFPAQPQEMTTPTKPKLKRLRETTPIKELSVPMQIQIPGSEQPMDSSVANPSPTQMESSNSPVMEESMQQPTQDLNVSVDSDEDMSGESPNRKLDFLEEAQPSTIQDSDQVDDSEFDSVDLHVESTLVPKPPTLSQVTEEMEDLDLQIDDTGGPPVRRKA
jgi:hypothetical protein